MRSLPVVLLCVSLLQTGQVVVAQDLTHPTRMGLPASDFERPDPGDYRMTLENGFNAYIARASQVPLVNLSAFIRIGLVDDEKQGAAEALRHALQSGPANLSSEEFKAGLKEMTASYSVEMHNEWTEVSLNVPAEDLERALSLFAGVLLSPAISAANIDAAAKAATPGAEDLQGEDGPALYEGSLNSAVELFRAVIFAGHPYGYAPAKSDFAALEVADVADLHASYFVPGNIVLAIAGDIEVESMHESVASLFGSWARKNIPPSPRIGAVVPARTKQYTFPAEKLQSWLVFGHDLPTVPDSDQAALEVMNYILAGGHLWTRKTIETRYKYGYTNDASGFLEQNWYGPGSYDFRSYSRPDVIGEIYNNMREEIFRIRAEKVSADELFVAQGALTDGAFQVRYLDGYSTTRNFALEFLRFRNHARSATYVERIRAVTVEDVLASARKYLRPDEMQVILVGQAENLLD